MIECYRLALYFILWLGALVTAKVPRNLHPLGHRTVENQTDRFLKAESLKNHLQKFCELPED